MSFVAGYFGFTGRKLHAKTKQNKKHKNSLPYFEQTECIISYLLNSNVSKEFFLVSVVYGIV